MVELSNTEILAFNISAVCHDYQHPGVNNAYLSNIRDPVAFRHNDKSVLENHHIAASFELMASEPELNWMDNFSNEVFKDVRQLMIGAVLATDMEHHNSRIKELT
jgi:hypothetical protein